MTVSIGSWPRNKASLQVLSIIKSKIESIIQSTVQSIVQVPEFRVYVLYLPGTYKILTGCPVLVQYKVCESRPFGFHV